MTRRIAWIPLLGLAGCCGLFASVPDEDTLCALASARWAEDWGDAGGLWPAEFACEDLLTDSGAGEGSITVVATRLLASNRGGRVRLEQARDYQLRRYDQGWRAEDPSDPVERERDEILAGVALDPEVDPVAIASADVELPVVDAALQVPGGWFAGPWLDAGADGSEEDRERAWEALTEDQVCVAEEAVLGAEGAGSAGRYGIAGAPGRPHWLEPPDVRNLFRGGGAAYVEVTPSLIRVNGAAAVSLSDGMPASDELRGMLIAPLYDRLQETADDAKVMAARWPGCPCHGRILLGADRRVPGGTLMAVIYTAGQAQFGEPYLLVQDADPTPVGQLLDREAPGGGALRLYVTGSSYRLGEEGEELEATAVLAAVADGAPTGASVEVGPEATVGDMAVGLDAVHAQGASCVMLGAGDTDLATADAVTDLPAGRVPAVLPEVVSVLPIQLPAIGLREDPCAMFIEEPSLLSGLGDLESIFGSEGIGVGASSFIGGIIGSQYGEQYGSGGLGSRGSGLGGGGTAEGLGGLGTRGRGSGASGYGSGGGYFGSKAATPNLKSGTPAIEGQLDASVIDSVIRRHLAQIRYCYQRELNKDPSLSGKIVVKFTIAADGTVSDATIDSSTMNSEAVESCLCGRFLRFVFPEPEGGGIVVVTYPFVFTGDSG